MCWNGLAVAAAPGDGRAETERRRARAPADAGRGAAVAVTPLVFAPFVASTSWRARVPRRGGLAARRGRRAAPAARVGDTRRMERVLVLAGDAVEDLELFYVLYRLREAGYEVDIAALSRRTMRTVVHDFEPDSDAYVEKPGRRVEPDLAFSEVEPERYAGLVIPGGRAPEYIRVDPDVRRIVAPLLRPRPARRDALPRPAGARRARLPAGTQELRLPAARPGHRGGGWHVRRGSRRRRRQHGLLPRLGRPRRVVEGVRRGARARRGSR